MYVRNVNATFVICNFLKRSTRTSVLLYKVIELKENILDNG